MNQRVSAGDRLLRCVCRCCGWKEHANLAAAVAVVVVVAAVAAFAAVAVAAAVAGSEHRPVIAEDIAGAGQRIGGSSMDLIR